MKTVILFLVICLWLVSNCFGQNLPQAVVTTPSAYGSGQLSPDINQSNLNGYRAEKDAHNRNPYAKPNDAYNRWLDSRITQEQNAINRSYLQDKRNSDLNREFNKNWSSSSRGKK